MARITVNEYDLLNQYVLISGSAVGDIYRLEVIMATQNNAVSLLKLKSTQFGFKKAVSIKLHMTCSTISNPASSKLYAGILANDFNENVSGLTCPAWRNSVEIGTAPNVINTEGVYDLTSNFSLRDITENGIALRIARDATVNFFTSRNITGQPYFEIEYADAPDIPSDLSPAFGANVEITGSNGRFSWKHNPSTVSNLPQKGYVLQMSGNGVDWTTVSATTSNQYADVSTASIPSGDFYWRVQAIDTDDVPSDYSAQQYAYRGTIPAAPTITTSVFTSSKPRIEWTTAYTQAGFRIQILQGSTPLIDATVEGSEKLYDVPIALANSVQYTVRLTVKDTAAHYSVWAEASISTSYAVPSVPTFILSKKKDSVTLTITNPAGGAAVVQNDIYRLENGEYIRIGSTDGTTYDDWSAGNGELKYKVAAVGASGESMSAAGTVNFSLTTVFLTAVDDTEHPFEVEYNLMDRADSEHDVTLMEYAGRSKPVAEFGEIIQRSIAVAFDSGDPDEYERLYTVLARKVPILYRSPRAKLYGVCTNPSDKPQDYTGIAYNLSFVINEIEYSEVV